MKCNLCQATVNKETSPFPVSHSDDLFWYCSKGCLGIAWPDAAAPIALGDMIESDLLAFDEPRKIVQLTGDEIYSSKGFQYLDIVEQDILGGDHVPHGMWVIMNQHPDDRDLFFLVPWACGDEVYEAAVSCDEEGESSSYVPMKAQSIYTGWTQKDKPESKTPQDFVLFLGRGVWRHISDIDLSCRFRKMTDETLKAARQAIPKVFT